MPSSMAPVTARAPPAAVQARAQLRRVAACLLGAGLQAGDGVIQAVETEEAELGGRCNHRSE
ncbi:hypothetical protein [Streptomyces sp. NPDC000880]